MRLPSRLPTAAALLLGAGWAAVGPFPGDACASEVLPDPPIRAGGYRAEILPPAQTVDGAADTDVYAARLVAGEELGVTVSVSRQSPLYPDVEIVGPDDVVRTYDNGASPQSRGVRVRSFRIDRTGVWRVRVGARLDTFGPYAVKFTVRPAPPTKTEVPADATGAESEASLAFEALPGSAVRLEGRVRGGGAPALRSVTDAEGGDVPADEGGTLAGASVAKGAVVRAETASLVAADGPVAATFLLPASHRGATLTATVRRPALPKGTRKLLAVEPFLDPRTEPHAGVHGRSLRITGRNLSSSPRVFFGDVEATDVSADAFGTRIDVDPPPGTDGDTVRVAVVASDGQGTERADYFFYVPPPVADGITDGAGAPAVGSSTEGGRVLRIRGAEFRSGITVRFGGNGVLPQILSPGEMLVVTPARAPGIVRVTLEDAYLHAVELPEDFEYKLPPVPGATPFSPAAAAAESPTEIDLLGAGFELEDVASEGATDLPTVWISPTRLRVTLPPGADGTSVLTVRDRVGTAVAWPALRRRAAPTITSIALVSGPFRGTREVAVSGGAVVRLSGSAFDVTDTVTVGGGTAAFVAFGAGTADVLVPPGAAGDADVVVRDALGRSATRTAGLRYVGFTDVSAATTPAPSAADDGSALRAAAADLDGDTARDDLVIVSQGSSPGTTAVRTRVLRGGTGGALADRTATDFPAKGFDPAGLDDANARAVLVADLDGLGGPELVVGGASPSSGTQGDVRVFTNAAGVFTWSGALSLGTTARAAVSARDESGATHVVTGARAVRGMPTALALGDLDRDGDADLVVGRDLHETTFAGLDPTYVNFTTNPPSVTAANAAAHVLGITRYHAATQVWTRGAGGFTDASATVLPGAGDSASARLPAFAASDVAIARIDGDVWPDLVVTCADPTLTTPYGLTQGKGKDSARIATRILLNDGTGRFTDRTATWMPPATDPEWWQADRLATTDLDGDGDTDLVLLVHAGVDGWKGTDTRARHALRILRNDGSAFTDVTASALPALAGTGAEDYRGAALAAGDTDGDGRTDLLVATTAVRRDARLNRLPSARLLLAGTSGISFRDGTGFLPLVTADSGEADDLLLTDLLGAPGPALVLSSETRPGQSVSGRFLRVFAWQR